MRKEKQGASSLLFADHRRRSGLRYKNKIYTSGIGPQYIALPIDFAKIVKIRQISIKNFFKSIDIKKSIVHN